MIEGEKEYRLVTQGKKTYLVFERTSNIDTKGNQVHSKWEVDSRLGIVNRIDQNLITNAKRYITSKENSRSVQIVLPQAQGLSLPYSEEKQFLMFTSYRDGVLNNIAEINESVQDNNLNPTIVAKYTSSETELFIESFHIEQETNEGYQSSLLSLKTGDSPFDFMLKRDAIDNITPPDYGMFGINTPLDTATSINVLSLDKTILILLAKETEGKKEGYVFKFPRQFGVASALGYAHFKKPSGWERVFSLPNIRETEVTSYSFSNNNS